MRRSCGLISDEGRRVLDIRELVCSYGKVVALKGLSISVQSGQLVSLIGANGAGKTTTLRAISGLLKPTSGYILFNGNDITYAPARKVLSLGIACCPEGRRVFPYLTVRENLEMGCYLRSDRAGIAGDMERIFSDFPVLAERAGQAAGTLSGGEQQMLAIGRALMSRPALISVRRAFAGSCSKHRGTYLRDHSEHPRAGNDSADGRAKCACCTRNVRLRLCARKRQSGAPGYWQGIAHQPQCATSLSRRLRRAWLALGVSRTHLRDVARAWISDFCGRLVESVAIGVPREENLDIDASCGARTLSSSTRGGDIMCTRGAHRR